jgi:hypothetical protein
MAAYHGRDFSRDYLKEHSEGVEDKDVYCFGIYTGWSVGQVGVDFKTNNLKPNNFWGFDSFEGLPEEKEGIEIHPDWHKGAFDSRKLKGVQHGVDFNNGDFVEGIKANFKNRSGYDIDMIKGFYSDSLTDELVIEKGMKPASFVDMDVDIYISTQQSMDWMARNGLIQNTVFYFDDWFKAKEPYTFGEALAMKEICDKYGYNYKKLWELDSGLQTVFLINY